ncbi:MAG: aldehyde ferredoxin oxidoreductase family protein [Bacillota bacterium]|jgi:aldehyde:ferredoxin oxidoreductase
MSLGYTGSILHVDLTKEEVFVEHPSEEFYRTYLGGPGIGLYYLLKEKVKDVDPLGPENVMIFAPGLLTGTQSPCVPRFTVCSKSPLTGALGKSEAGGYWAPQLKRAGFDALVIRGKAARPVFLWIKGGKAEIRSAEHIWGKDTGTTQEMIRSELNDKRIQIAQIGPGGENLVRYACIANDLSHFNGRNGLGAVMGSKNLKAIAVLGSGQIPVHDSEKIKKIFKWTAQETKTNPLSISLHEHGTPLGIGGNNAAGVLPTNNWQTGVFPSAGEIGADKLEEYLVEKGGCFACPIRCKRVVEINDDRVKVDPIYGGPEYETLVTLGSNCGIADIKIVCKANELCNRLGIDTISAGMAISFAMQCYENGLITKEDTGGLDLKFGNEDAVLTLLEQIALRKGFGSMLAEGSKAAAEKIGQGSSEYLVETKGQEVPAHDPRVKSGLGIQYAISFNGADHWFAQHDPFFTNRDSYGFQNITPLGITEPVPAAEVSTEKARLMLYCSFLTFFYDCLGACAFGFVARSIIPLDKTVELVKGATGWNTSLWELQKIGERCHTMARIYNIDRCGLRPSDDKLPAKYYTPINGGPLDGKMALDPKSFNQMIQDYYEMAGWDKETGLPLQGKLSELNLNSLVR